MAQPPPTASSLLPTSLFDSIKTYLMNIDVSAYTEYEIKEQAKKSEMWFLGEEANKKEIRKLRDDAAEMDFGTIPFSAPITECDSDSTDTENELETSGKQVLEITPLNEDDEEEEYDGIEEPPDERHQSKLRANNYPPLKIPQPQIDSEMKEMCTKSMKYKVSDNESLNTIALKFNISPNMLKQINAISSEVIFPGQNLFVPLQQMEHQAIDTVLHPTKSHSAHHTKQFYKYQMKRITRFDGSVTGTTLLTSNALMFRADVTDKLVIEHGQSNYNASIPLDSISEILMFESFEQMLGNIRSPGMLPEDACPKCKSVKSQLRYTSQFGMDDEDSETSEMNVDTAADKLAVAESECDFPDVKIVDPSEPSSLGLTSSHEESCSLDSKEIGSPTSMEYIKDAHLDDFNPTTMSHDNCKRVKPTGLIATLGLCTAPNLCQHEFRDYFEGNSRLKYSAKKRVNPFNLNINRDEEKHKLVIPEFKSNLNKDEIVEARMNRVDSDISLATMAFFNKIDANTTHMQTVLQNAKKHEFTIFISLHSILCSRTHGKPSFQIEAEEGHKQTHFWFCLSDKDVTKLIDKLFMLCAHLEPIEDSTNCLLRCAADYYKQLEDIILPDVVPKFVPREIDTDLLYESFSGTLHYNEDISVLLTEDMMVQLQPYLPCHIIGINLVLLYSIRAHGMTLRSLYTKCNPYSDSPCLLLIKDTQGYIFGAYMSHGIIESPKYYGTGETFLFRLSPDPQYYFWQGDNHYFMMGTSTYFTIGAGDGQFALYIDEMLQKGTSNRSQTFYNEVLSAESTFDILDVEVWCFADEPAESSDIDSLGSGRSRYSAQFRPTFY